MSKNNPFEERLLITYLEDVFVVHSRKGGDDVGFGGDGGDDVDFREIGGFDGCREGSGEKYSTRSYHGGTRC